MTTTRSLVLSAFKSDERFCYSSIVPFEYNNDIDNMAWIGAMTGAALKAGDMEVASVGIMHLTTLIRMGEHARCYYPTHKRPIGGDWVESREILGYSYKRKQQASAGPMAYYWARAQSSSVSLPIEWVPDPTLRAKAFVLVAPVYGYLIRFVPSLRQHINTVMFAHLLLGKTPPGSMRFLAIDNPLYSYLYGNRCVVPYQNTGDWPAKDWPGAKIDTTQSYTPICQLTADLLQSTL